MNKEVKARRKGKLAILFVLIAGAAAGGCAQAPYYSSSPGMSPPGSTQ